MKKLVLAGALALIAVSASACGRMADLEAPRPRETERDVRGSRAPGLPEPGTVNQPNRTQPIDGGPSSNPYDGPGNRPG